MSHFIPIRDELVKKTTKRQFKVPEFKTRFTRFRVAQYHNCPQQKQWMEEVYQASGMTKEQLSRYEIYDVEYGLTWSAAMIYSHSINIRRYEILMKLMVIFYAIDDYWEFLDENGDKTMAHTELMIREIVTGIDMMTGTVPQEDISLWKSYSRFVYDLLNEMYHAQKNYIQKKRFAKYVRGFFTSIIAESQITYKGLSKMKSFDEFCELRHMTGAADPIFQFIEYANDIFVSEEDYEELEKGFINLVSKICFITNDVYSFEKEYIQQKGNLERIYNAVAYTVVHEKCSIEEAMQKLIAIVIQLEKECLNKFEELKSDKNCNPDKLSFLDGLELMIAANYNICTKMTRYNRFPVMNGFNDK